MIRRRARVHLTWPPADPAGVKSFPRRALDRGVEVFRIVQKGRRPWWFGNSMEGRFDLAEPHGTCYLATDPVSASLEVLRPAGTGGPVLTEFLASRRLRRLRLPRDHSLADLTSRGTSAYGVTLEIHTVTPYHRPQAWAACLFRSGAEGLWYLLRNDPQPSPGIALFGRAGERRWRSGREEIIPQEVIARLRDECGITVADRPRFASLRIHQQ